jgi:hypothetical protein
VTSEGLRLGNDSESQKLNAEILSQLTMRHGQAWRCSSKLEGFILKLDFELEKNAGEAHGCRTRER